MRYFIVIALLISLTSCLVIGKETELDKLHKINKHVNAYPYYSDKMLYGKADHWATPFEFLMNGGGDCEDYAIMKHHLLEDKTDTKLLVVQVRATEEYHAILDVRGYILDNVTNEIIKRDSLEFLAKYKFLYFVVL